MTERAARPPGHRSKAGDREWPEADKKLLRKFWGKKSAKDIGEMFSPTRTPSAVVGKSHRMGLPQLPSVIRPKIEKAPPKPAPIVEPPSEEDIAWKEFTRWAPGDPSLWPWRQGA